MLFGEIVTLMLLRLTGRMRVQRILQFDDNAYRYETVSSVAYSDFSHRPATTNTDNSYADTLLRASYLAT